MQALFRKNGIIHYRNSPIDDDFEDTYAVALFEAVKVLRQLVVQEKRHVFIHCCSGISRCTTLFLCYLMLVGFHDDEIFSSTKKLQNVNQAAADNYVNPKEVPAFLLEPAIKLKKIYERSMPNYKIIKRVIDENRNFFE